MNPEIGHFALALACVFAFAQGIFPIWGANRRDLRLMQAAPALALGQFVALAVAAAALVHAAVTDDFSVLNVAQNSSSLKPLLYKITGTWGDHEGSILLWCLILGACGAAVAVFGRTLPTSLRARVIGVLGLTAAGFELFALLTSDPFTRLWPAPLQGQGMNPLLQDPGLAFHPPILYCGYVGFAIPFAFAVAALLEGRIDAAWGRWVRPWALVSWCFLTGGIALGSWWAYYELGWGGFWFWDPVENASLLPWLAGTALVHSAIVVEKREALKVWTVLLAIGTFSLSLSGTFLVRSGILNSVHSFAADPNRGVFILALLGLVIGGSLVLFVWRAPVLAPSGLFAPISREGMLVVNNILLCSMCAVVLTGTIFPLIAELVGAKISVGEPFFNATVFPLAIPLMLAMAVGPTLSWKRAELLPAFARLWWAALIAAIVGAIVAIGWHRVLPALAFLSSAWIIAGSAAELAERTQLFRVPLAQSWLRARRLRLATWGSAVAHAGLGVTVAGIAGMALSQQAIVAVSPGQVTHLAGYDWTLNKISTVQGPNYVARVATVTVTDHGHLVAILHPGRRSFPLQQQTTNDTSIRTNFLVDLYSAMGDETGGRVVLRLHVNLLAPWIWLGALVMASGGGLSLLDRRRVRIGAPARARVPAVPA